VRTRIWYAANRAGLGIPFPIRNILVENVADTLAAEAEHEEAERRAAIGRVELFRGLDDSDVALLAHGMKRRLFAAGEVIVRQGAAGDSLFFVADGEVDVVLGVDSVERNLATLHRGDILGELSLLTGENRTATCIAKTDVELHEVSHEVVQMLLDAKPALAESFSAILTGRQSALHIERDDLSATTPNRAEDSKGRLLARIRSYFRLG
jgi:CRP-like cAMP-binding protein